MKDCNACDFWRSRANRKKGVLIPGGFGKCTRPEGHCDPDIVRGKIGDGPQMVNTSNKEDKKMAKRKLSLFKKTAVEPEVVEEAPATLEAPSEDSRYVPVAYDGFDDSPPDFVKPLSETEKKRRQELENLISRKFNSFLDVCYALREISQRMYYRDTHARFSDYCKEIFEVSGRRAYQLIDAADVIDMVRNVHNCGCENVNSCTHENVNHGSQGNVHHGGQIEWIPQNEGQARVLVKFKDKPEAIQTIVTEAIQTAPDGKITATHLKKTAKHLHLLKVRNTVSKAKKKANQSPKISEDFRKAYNDFLDAINIERASEFKHTDRNEVIRAVRVVLDALETEL